MNLLPTGVRWTQVFSPNDAAPTHAFQVQSGWKHNLAPSTIEDYIRIFLPDQLIEEISDWTNKRASIFAARNDTSSTYVDTTTEEMKVFIGLS